MKDRIASSRSHELSKCHYCGCAQFEKIETALKDFLLFKCFHCGLIERGKLISWEDNFDKEGLNAFIGNYNQGELWRRKIARQRLNLIRIFIPKGLILDYGCATGFFLDEAFAYKYKPIGIEANPSFRQEAKNKFPTIEVLSPAEIDTKSIKVDVITIFDTLGCLTDLRDFFFFASQILRPGGIIFITSFLPDECIRNNGDILCFNYYITPEFMLGQMKEYGCEKIAIWDEPKNLNNTEPYTEEWWQLKLETTKSVKMVYYIFRKN